MVFIAKLLDTSTELTLGFNLAAIPENFAIAVTQTLRTILKSMTRVGNSAAMPKDFISSEDRQRLQSWNIKPPFASEKCLHHLVEDSVRLVPDAEAVCAWDGSFTYRELDNVSTSVARHLLSIGVDRGVFVPFAFEKSRWAVVAMLATLKAGGAFVPLDPANPPSRLKEICDNVNANIVLTSNSHAPTFTKMIKHVVVLSPKTIEQFQDELVNEFHLPLVQTHDPVFVLFTSGSTGKPKGIVHEHGSMSTHTLAHGATTAWNARVLQFSAYTWDPAAIDVFTALAFQGCICIPSEEDRKFDVVGVINRMKVELSFMTPSFAALIDPDSIPTLKTLIVGGESLKQENVRRWAGKVSLVQVFGPAETLICAKTKVDARKSRPEALGRSLNCIAWLVDPEDHEKLVPIGAIGELVVAGPSIAREYLNDEAKTNSSFFLDPPWAVGGNPAYQRYYKTGDLLKYNPGTLNGALDFIGRKDSQIKRNGQRVELGEIEHHLANLPDVAVSMVAAPNEGCFKGDLVAIVQLREALQPEIALDRPITIVTNGSLTLGMVRRHLSGYVPSYMIPTALLVVTSLPLTSSLKLQKRRVNSWLAGLESRPPQEATTNDLESSCRLDSSEVTGIAISRKVADLVAGKDWAYRLRFEGFDFGLQQAGVGSIQLISLSNFLQKEYGTKVPMSTILSSHVTIRDLARLVDQRNQPSSDSGQSPEEPPKSVDVLQEAERMTEDLLQDRKVSSATRNVFLTGSTGYLGSEILRQLMDMPNVTVRTLVRSPTKSEAMVRIIKQAREEGWWKNSYASRIDAWPGDMAEENLGLSDDQLQYFGVDGELPGKSCIHAIIQNGATVHYNLDYDSVKATNVDSTHSLLHLTANSKTVNSFVYVTGGQKFTASEDDDVRMAKQAEISGGGYEQSKLVGELMVKTVAGEAPFREQNLKVIKPGYIVGNAEHGSANPSDYLWRLVAGCLEVGAYNVDEVAEWVFVSDMHHVAEGVIAGIFEGQDDDIQTKDDVVKKILDGLLLADFWDVVQHGFGYSLKPLPYVEWLELIRAAVKTGVEAHPLFPVMHILEKGSSGIGSEEAPEDKNSTARMKDVVRRNVQSLIDVGFLPTPSQQRSRFLRLN